MKNFIITVLCLGLITFIVINANKYSDLIANKITDNHTLIIKDKNEYAKNTDFLFVSLNNSYIPYSYNDLLNIIYTVINNGWDTFTFYCPSEYTDCISDIEKISKDEVTLTHINNYVHPFNSFTMLSTSMSDSGEITLKVKHVYTEDQIKAINTEIERIMSLVLNNKNSTYDNIKAMHDYIINTTKYDQVSSSEEVTASSIAYGALFDHLATCNGYTDTMAIFLDKIGVKNFKIATTSEDLKNSETGHVWNAVYLNNKWLHMDLTWDDPVSNTGEDYLYHKYFLVTTEEMQKADAGEVNIEEHNFNKKYYLEFNEKSQNLI